MTATRTPCSMPDGPCDFDGSGEPCDRHAREQAHAEGEHEFCGLECEVTMPSYQMRNAILWRAIPGSPRMLAELERRAAEALRAEAVAENGQLRATLAAVCGAVAEAIMCPDEDCNGHLDKLERILGGVGLLGATDPHPSEVTP